MAPLSVADAGDQADNRFVEFFIRFVEFFIATLRDRHTRKADARAAGDFFAWCEQ